MTTQHNTMNYITSSLNGHINDTPLSGFTKLNSEPGTIYTFINANTHKTPEGLAFYREDDSLIIEHYGKKTVALKNFFSHKDNPAKFVVDNGEAKDIITADSTVIYENGRAHIIASEPLLVANSELTINPFDLLDAEVEPEAVAEESNFFADNWVWFAVGGAVITAGALAGSSSDSSSETPKTPDVPDGTAPILKSVTATGNTITLTYDKALDGQLPKSSAFHIEVIGGDNNPVTRVTVSESGDAIVLTLTDTIATGSNVTITYTDPTTANDSNAIQDRQGNDADSFDIQTGLVVDGYIQGAQLYADYNKNGIAEESEKLEGIITDEFGRFFLIDVIQAPLIAIGGTSTDTGIKNNLTMRAPEGATILNPITTVVQQYLSANPGETLEQAEEAVKEILGITTLPAGISLSDYDPISSGNKELQKIAAQIVTIAMQAESTTVGGGSTVFEALAASNKPLDLTEVDDVTAITQNTGINVQTVQALVTQTSLIKDADNIDDIATQQKGLVVALTDDTGTEDNDRTSSVGTIEVTSKFADGVTQYSVDEGKTWGPEFTAKEGENTVHIRQVDAEDKVLSEVTRFTFTLDTIVPTVVITDNIEGIAKGEVIYHFTFSEAMSGFTVDDIMVTGGSKRQFTRTGDMAYSLVVVPDSVSTTPITVNINADVATDVAGNGNAVATQSVQEVDTTELFVSGVKISADTGGDTSDLITKVASQTITATLSVVLEEGDILSGSVDGGENWIDITDKVTDKVISWDGATLIEGEQSIVFKIKDPDGKDGANTGNKKYVLDTKAPTQTVSAINISDDTGNSESDFITNESSQTITASLSDSLKTGDLLYGSVDSGETWIDITDKVTDKATGTVISWETSLIEGKHSIVFKVADLAGNEADTLTPIDYTLDTSTPTQTINNVRLSDDTGNSESDFITNESSQTITASLSAALATDEVLQGSTDSGTTWTIITDKVTGTEIIWDDISLIEGEHSIVLKITDLAGNFKDTGVTNYVLDITAPAQTIDRVSFSQDTGSNAFDLITKVASQTIKAQLSAALKTGDILFGSVDGGTTWTDITDKATGTEISWDGASLIEGEYSIVFKLTDKAGNEGGGNISNPAHYVLNTTAPTQTVDSVSFSDDTGISDSDFITKSKAQTITATLSAALATDEMLYVSVDNGTTWTNITDKVTGTAISWDGASLIEGENSIVFKITNLADNQGNTAASIEYELDTTAPTQTVDSVTISHDSGSSQSDLITNEKSQTITAELSEMLKTGDRLYGSVDGGSHWLDITDKVTDTAISWDGASLTEGENLITFKITDAVDNSKKTDSKHYTLDTTAPTVVITDNTEGTATGDVTYNFAFSEAVTDFTVDDITISSGSKGRFSKINDMTYSLVITPLVGSTTPIMVDVKAGVATDIAGNVNTAAVQSVQQVDTPILGVSAVTISEDTGSSESDFVTKTTAQTISARLSESLATGNTLYGSVDGGAKWTEITDKVTGRDFSWDTSLVEGEHSIVFKIKDPDGKDSAETGLQSYTLDTIASTQTTLNVTLMQYRPLLTHASGGDQITRTDTQNIFVQFSEPFATGDILYGSVDGGATWTDITDKMVIYNDNSFTWKTTLIEGKYSIVFKITDLAGNEGVNIGFSGYVLDTIAPTQTVDNVIFSGDTGSDGTVFTTKEQSQTITAQLSSALVTNDKLYGSVNGGAKWIDITDRVTGTEISWQISLMEGENAIVFKITDRMYNDSAETGSKNYVLDTSAPTQTVGNLALSDDTGSSGTDFITKIAPQTIHAQLSAALATDDILSGSVDGGETWIDITDKVTGTVISWDGATLIEGENSIVFRIADQYGNAGANTGSKDYVLDITPPTQTVDSVRFSYTTDTGSSSYDLITKTASNFIQAELSAGLATGDTLYGSVDGGANWIDITDKITTGIIINWDGVILVEGSHEIVFKIRDDLAGNEGANIGSTNYVLDKMAPTQTIDNIAFSADTGSSANDFITNERQQTITATLSAGLATNDRLYATTDNGDHWIDITDTVTGTDISWDVEILSGIRYHHLFFRVVDLAGNEGETSADIFYSLDTTSPTIAITDDTAGIANGAVTYTFKFSERVTGFTAESIEVTGGTKGALELIPLGIAGNRSTYQLTVTPPYDSQTPITVSVKADSGVMDYAGNKLAATVVAEVQEVLAGKAPTDTSIVIFDLTTGKSSTHSDRTFTDAVTDIYIIVHAESARLTFDASDKWHASNDLTGSIKVHLISSDGKPILGPGGLQVTKAAYYLERVRFSSVDNTACRLAKEGTIIRYASSGGEFKKMLWSDPIPLASGVLGGTIAAGVMTSQGLV